MKSDAEKFADFVEYREAMAALQEFGPGFDITVERKWPELNNAHFVVTIARRGLSPGLARGLAAVQSDVNLLRAVRVAVGQMRKELAAEEAARGQVVPGAVATGQQGPSDMVMPSYLAATLDEALKKAGVTPGVPCVPAPKAKSWAVEVDFKPAPPDLAGGPTPERVGS